MFSFFWGLQFILVSSSYYSEWIHWPLILPAFFLLFCPSSLTALLLISIGQILVCCIKMPAVANHGLLLAMLNLALIVCFFRRIFRKDLNREGLVEDAAPVFRLVTLIVYFFTFFHKMNRDFLNPDSSCAAFFYRDLIRQFPFSFLPVPEGSLAYVIIFSILLAEVSVPLLLIFSVTRGYGILVGILFHLLLGVTHPNFSVMVFGLYLFFLPPSFYLEAEQFWKGLRLKIKGLRFWMIPSLIIIMNLLFPFTPPYVAPGFWQSPLQKYHMFAWMVFTFTLIGGYLYFFFLKSISFHEMKRPFRISWKPLMIFPFLAFINGMTPYLGLKTSTSFAMYSNLVTEGGVSNHLIIPKGAIQLLDYQDDVVTLLDSNSFAFFLHIKNRIPMPYIELRKLVNRLSQEGKKNIRLSYLRNNRLVHLTHAERDAELSTPLPWYLEKFVDFRLNWQLSSTDKKCGW